LASVSALGFNGPHLLFGFQGAFFLFSFYYYNTIYIIISQVFFKLFLKKSDLFLKKIRPYPWPHSNLV
jgi:hypothetical protein